MNGNLPAELGNLTNLERLLLEKNDFTGSIPLSFAKLPLNYFSFYHTNLCEPQDEDFQVWLEGVHDVQSTNVACEVLQALTVTSQNPDTGVSITVSPADANEEGDGATTFSRTYAAGTSVTLTAPPSTPTGTVFATWQVDGVTVSGNPIELTMDTDYTATAIYEAAQHTLTVASQQPDAGIEIAVAPSDNDGNADGTTVFSRTYDDGTQVTLTAPATAPDSSPFVEWWLDGSTATTDPTLQVTMNASHTATAVYGTATYGLTVASQNPDEGINVAVSPNDHNGDGEGTTAFSRTYEAGTEVTLTAPATAPGGETFVEWQVGGATVADATLQVTMNADYTATAIYRTPRHTLTVASQNPSEGISITMSPADENGEGDGVTTFSRTYANGAPVILTAPEETPDGNPFGKWVCSASETTEVEHELTLTSDDTCTAYFLMPPEEDVIETKIDETVMLNWADVPGVDRYHVQISDEPTFGKTAALLVDADTVTVSSFEVPPGLLSSEQNYFWRIRSGVERTTDMRWSAWSGQTVIPTSVEQLDDTVPESFTLENYPNPFNPVTTIQYTLPEAGPVKLTIFDATGRQVATLVDLPQTPGRYEATFDARDLPSGTYFYRLQAGDFATSKAMLLVK